MKKIPKIINYCWFGNKPKSDLINKCIESWRKNCIDYEIKEWNESNFDVTINDYVKEAYDAQKFAFVSDYVRLWVIYNYGGIYLDTDVELIKPINDLLEYDTFFAAETDDYINTGLGFGSKKNSNIIKILLESYEGEHFKLQNGKYNTTTCTVRNTKIIKEKYNIENFSGVIIKDGICFLPKEYFCPLNYVTKKMKKTDNTYGIHWYNESWMTNRQKFVRKIKNKIKSALKIRE